MDEVYDAPEGYEELYPETRGSWEGSRQAVEDSRDEATDWFNSYYTSPEPASLVSDNLDSLLEPDSEYMIAAQEASEKARGERGYLDSGFNKGMGTVAAIDSAFDTALEDSYTDIFNKNEVNQANRTNYLTAYETAMKTFLSQGEQTQKEHSYDLIVKGMEEAQEDLMELKDKEYEYADLLQASQHEDNMDRVYYKQANDLAMRVIRNKSGLQGYYLDAYANVISSDIAQGLKYDQLVGLGYQIDMATEQAVSQQAMNVGDNPYGISYIDQLPSYDQGSPTDEAFVWSVNDAEFEYEEFQEVFGQMYYDIHQQTTHQERDMSTLWYVFNDLLGAQMNAIDRNSQEFIDKMEYYNRLKYEKLGDEPSNDEIEEFFRDMYLIGTTQVEPAPLNEEQGYEEPRTSTTYSWDSATETITSIEGTVAGGDLYYAQQACTWPMEWSYRTETCVEQGG